MLLQFSVVTIIFLLTLPIVSPVAIDNEVIGVPQIQCTEQAITFSVRTRNIFRGNIYIKGQYGVAQCRQEYFNNGYAGGTFSVRIGDCGMRRIRQLQPHGMNYMLVFVTNFHPQFMTKVDRAYNVRCFYAQADKTVNSELEVSMINTESLEQATMLMPNCEYSVRAGTVDGPRVRFVRIGDQLVHRWECDNPNYGMLVKNCFANDGGGTSVRVLDPRGCPVFTPVIQGNLQYDNSLNLAFVPVWAYKFPDRSQLYFQCQIQVCNKRDNECVGISPPNCPLVSRPEFIPNSLINSNVEPTRVIGTFPGDIGPDIASNLDPRPVNPAPILPIGPIPPRLPFAAREAIGDEEFQSQTAQFSPNEFPSAQSLLTNRVHNGGPFSSSRRSDTVRPDQQNDTSDVSTSTASFNLFNDSRINGYRRRHRSPPSAMVGDWGDRLSDDIPIPIPRPRTRNRTISSSRSQSTVDEETLDVIADPVFVVDPDIVDEDQSSDPDVFRSTNRQSSSQQDQPLQLVCINHASIVALCCALALMTTTTISMTVYIFKEPLIGLFRRRPSWNEQYAYGLNNFNDGGLRPEMVMMPLPGKENNGNSKRLPPPRYIPAPYVYHSDHQHQPL